MNQITITPGQHMPSIYEQRLQQIQSQQNYPHNNYNQQPMPQQNFIPQQVQSVAPQIQFFVVNSLDDFKKSNIGLNQMHVGINRVAGEVYIKQINNDGNIDVELYAKPKVQNQEELLVSDKLDTLYSKIENIENKLSYKGNMKNEYDKKHDAKSNDVYNGQQQSSVRSIPANDAGQRHQSTNGDND